MEGIEEQISVENGSSSEGLPPNPFTAYHVAAPLRRSLARHASLVSENLSLISDNFFCSRPELIDWY